ncbi:SRPBCC family protein [Gimibacter soli]|uniref:SRPBCC domain-containing protein n=1 Tax=Gimibacter soli TaxID=3024400 RepID=A0AAE9XRA7_9PROT|nr:SRPBCC domain-containing protein [Gimibacter soli]WCL53470.1 SRPBCC domain-containing protein [Gimibacter soli]
MKKLNSPAIRKTAFIKAKPETVWAFLTDKELLGEWYHPARETLAHGKPYMLGMKDDGKPTVWGEVVEFAPCSRLVTTFSIAPFNGGTSTVIWKLQSVEGGTYLELTHEGISEAIGSFSLALMAALDEGWSRHLARLASCNPSGA